MPGPITPLANLPSINDPANFATKADSLLTTQFPTLVSEINTFAATLSLVSTTDTSSTSNSIGTGSKSFTVTAGKSFTPGMYLVIADTAAPSTNSMYGQITSYSGTALVVNVLAVLGSGTKTAWTISQSAPGGAALGANADITTMSAVTALTTTAGVAIKGSTTNDNPAAGYVGEVLSAEVLAASAVSLTSGVITNIATINLTGGDWDVFGYAGLSLAGSTSITVWRGGSSLTSGATDASASFSWQQPAAVPGGNLRLAYPTTRISVASSTTVYLTIVCNFTVSTAAGFGSLIARRRR